MATKKLPFLSTVRTMAQQQAAATVQGSLHAQPFGTRAGRPLHQIHRTSYNRYMTPLLRVRNAANAVSETVSSATTPPCTCCIVRSKTFQWRTSSLPADDADGSRMHVVGKLKDGERSGRTVGDCRNYGLGASTDKGTGKPPHGTIASCPPQSQNEGLMPLGCPSKHPRTTMKKRGSSGARAIS